MYENKDHLANRILQSATVINCYPVALIQYGNIKDHLKVDKQKFDYIRPKEQCKNVDPERVTKKKRCTISLYNQLVPPCTQRVSGTGLTRNS